MVNYFINVNFPAISGLGGWGVEPARGELPRKTK